MKYLFFIITFLVLFIQGCSSKKIQCKTIHIDPYLLKIYKNPELPKHLSEEAISKYIQGLYLQNETYKSNLIQIDKIVKDSIIKKTLK